MCHERLLSRCPLTSAMCFLTWPTMTMTFPRKLGSRAVCGPWLSSPSAVKAVLNGMLMLPEMWPRIKLRRKRLRKTLCLHLWVWERPLQGSRRSLTQLGHLSLHQKSCRHGRKSDAWQQAREQLMDLLKYGDVPHGCFMVLREPETSNIFRPSGIQWKPFCVRPVMSNNSSQNCQKSLAVPVNTYLPGFVSFWVSVCEFQGVWVSGGVNLGSRPSPARRVSGGTQPRVSGLLVLRWGSLRLLLGCLGGYGEGFKLRASGHARQVCESFSCCFTSGLFFKST